MKYFKHFIIYVSIFTFFIVSLVGMYPVKVYAEVPNTQKVQAHNGSWGNYVFNYQFHEHYYTIDDATGIPISTITSPNYFYTSDGVTFFELSGNDLITAIINRGIGLIYQPATMMNITASFWQAIKNPLDQNLPYAQGGLYTSNREFLGYCLNDISGCYYHGLDQENPNITVSSQQTNNVYNFLNYYNQENPTLPDYINVIAPSNNLILSNYIDISDWPELQSVIVNNLNNATETHQNLAQFDWSINTIEGVTDEHFSFLSRGDYVPLDNVHYISNNTNDTNYVNFCQHYNLDKTHNEFSIEDFISNEPFYNGYIQIYVYDSNNVRITKGQRYSFVDGALGYNSNVYAYLGYNGTTNNGHYNQMLAGKNYTVYKDQETYETVCIDEDYEPLSYFSNTYNDFSTSNDNSFTLTNSTIDNSTTTNTNIYNDYTDSFNDYVNGSTVDGIEISNNISIEIDINYPDPTPTGPDDPNDPNNPNDPNDPDDPDTILDAILAALKRFFEIIGKLLGTVLAGLLEVIDTLLESIAGIMENLTGVTDFISALFSWIPSPVPEILGVGISICILAAIIKFLRG